MLYGFFDKQLENKLKNLAKIKISRYLNEPSFSIREIIQVKTMYKMYKYFQKSYDRKRGIFNLLK